MDRRRFLRAAAGVGLGVTALAVSPPVHAFPESGMMGLQPNAAALAAYISATYPNVHAIGGVRPDRLPEEVA